MNEFFGPDASQWLLWLHSPPAMAVGTQGSTDESEAAADFLASLNDVKVKEASLWKRKGSLSNRKNGKMPSRPAWASARHFHGIKALLP